jgi:hypothetical protein
MTNIIRETCFEQTKKILLPTNATITIEECQRLYASMPTQIATVWMQKGRQIHY